MFGCFIGLVKKFLLRSFILSGSLTQTVKPKILKMKVYLISLALLFTVNGGFAQNSAGSGNPVMTDLESQFSRLKSKSNHYRENNREYKVVDVRVLNQFWESVLGTVKNHEQNLLKGGKNTVAELEKSQATVSEQAKQIAALKQENALKEKAVQQNAYEVNNISILGVGINKSVFLIFSFVTIAGLLILCAVISSLYKKSKKVTDEKINAFQQMDNEFNEFKKAARERELKVKRELQTEMNHKEEMRQQLATLQKQAHA